MTVRVIDKVCLRRLWEWSREIAVLGTYFKKTLTIFKISARPTRTFEILTFRNQIPKIFTNLQALNPDQVIKVAQATESV